MSQQMRTVTPPPSGGRLGGGNTGRCTQPYYAHPNPLGEGAGCWMCRRHEILNRLLGNLDVLRLVNIDG